MTKKILSALCFSMLAASAAHADSYPSQPISIVVGFAPGGSNDVLARMLIPKLIEKLKVSVYVENKPGASGHIGLQYVSRAKPDGYTIYLGSSTPLVINPMVNKNVKFSLAKEAVVVGTFAKTFSLVATGANSPYKTLKQMTDASKDPARHVDLGTSGFASNSHVLLEVINAETGSKLAHVPYKGTQPAIIDSISGQLAGIIADYPGMLTAKEGNGVNVLAVADAKRSPLMPNVPTVKEALNIDIDMPNWFAFVAPKGTPENVRKVLFDAINSAAADKDVQMKLEKAGYQPFVMKTLQEVDSYISSEEAKLKMLVSKPGVLKALQN